MTPRKWIGLAVMGVSGWLIGYAVRPLGVGYVMILTGLWAVNLFGYTLTTTRGPAPPPAPKPIDDLDPESWLSLAAAEADADGKRPPKSPPRAARGPK